MKKIFSVFMLLFCLLTSCQGVVVNNDLAKLNLKGNVSHLKEHMKTYNGVKYTTHYQFDKYGYITDKTTYKDGYLEEKVEYLYNDFSLFQTKTYNSRRELSYSTLYIYDNNMNCLDETELSPYGEIRFIKKYNYDENGHILEHYVIGGYSNDTLSTTVYMTDDRGLITHRVSKDLTYDGHESKTMELNEQGDVVKLLYTFSIGKDSTTSSELSYEYVYDVHDNWLMQIKQGKDPVTRDIYYY